MSINTSELENCKGLDKSPEDILSFEALIKLHNDEIADPIKKIALEACIDNSPLYKSAWSGLKSFVQNEGFDELSELISTELPESFDDLMLKIVDDGLIPFSLPPE